MSKKKTAAIQQIEAELGIISFPEESYWVFYLLSCLLLIILPITGSLVILNGVFSIVERGAMGSTLTTLMIGVIALLPSVVGIYTGYRTAKKNKAEASLLEQFSQDLEEIKQQSLNKPQKRQDKNPLDVVYFGLANQVIKTKKQTLPFYQKLSKKAKKVLYRSFLSTRYRPATNTLYKAFAEGHFQLIRDNIDKYIEEISAKNKTKFKYHRARANYFLQDYPAALSDIKEYLTNNRSCLPALHLEASIYRAMGIASRNINNKKQNYKEALDKLYRLSELLKAQPDGSYCLLKIFVHIDYALCSLEASAAILPSELTLNIKKEYINTSINLLEQADKLLDNLPGSYKEYENQTQTIKYSVLYQMANTRMVKIRDFPEQKPKLSADEINILTSQLNSLDSIYPKLPNYNLKIQSDRVLIYSLLYEKGSDSSPNKDYLDKAKVLLTEVAKHLGREVYSDKEKSETYYNLGYGLYRMGKAQLKANLTEHPELFEQAVNFLQTSLNLFPDDCFVIDIIARLYYKYLNNFDGLQKFTEESLDNIKVLVEDDSFYTMSINRAIIALYLRQSAKEALQYLNQIAIGVKAYPLILEDYKTTLTKIDKIAEHCKSVKAIAKNLNSLRLNHTVIVDQLNGQTPFVNELKLTTWQARLALEQVEKINELNQLFRQIEWFHPLARQRKEGKDKQAVFLYIDKHTQISFNIINCTHGDWSVLKTCDIANPFLTMCNLKQTLEVYERAPIKMDAHAISLCKQIKNSLYNYYLQLGADSNFQTIKDKENKSVYGLINLLTYTKQKSTADSSMATEKLVKYLMRLDVQITYLQYLLNFKTADHYMATACLLLNDPQAKLILLADYGDVKGKLINLAENSIDSASSKPIYLVYHPGKNFFADAYSRLTHSSMSNNALQADCQALGNQSQTTGQATSVEQAFYSNSAEPMHSISCTSNQSSFFQPSQTAPNPASSSEETQITIFSNNY